MILSLKSKQLLEMISALHIPSPRLKKLNLSLADQIRSGRGVAHLIIKGPGKPAPYTKLVTKKLNDHHRGLNNGGQFRGWCMPEQTTGYIKASKHNLL